MGGKKLYVKSIYMGDIIRKFHVINVVFCPKSNHNQTEKYLTAFEDMCSKNIMVALQGSRAKDQKSGAVSLFESIGDGVYHGQFQEGIRFKSNTTAYDTTSQSLVPAGVNPDFLYNPFTIDFWFIPERHRLILRKQDSLKSFIKFLQEALLYVASGVDDVILTIVKSIDAIEEIFSSTAIKKLEVDIAYTNNDSNTSASLLIDEMLKSSNAKRSKFSLIAEDDAYIDILSNEFARGYLELSRNNGVATATIYDEDAEKIRKISTDETPEVFEMTIPENSEPNAQDFRNLIDSK